MKRRCVICHKDFETDLDIQVCSPCSYGVAKSLKKIAKTIDTKQVRIDQDE